MTIEEQIKILEAARDGKRIEETLRSNDGVGWCRMVGDFNFEDKVYRIAKPKLVNKNADIILLVNDKTGEIRMTSALLDFGGWRPVKFHGEWVVEE